MLQNGLLDVDIVRRFNLRPVAPIDFVTVVPLGVVGCGHHDPHCGLPPLNGEGHEGGRGYPGE